MSDRIRGSKREVGDRVRIDIPDETHHVHHHHEVKGEVVAVLSAVDRSITGAHQAGRYRVELDTGGVIDLRAEFLRPPI